MVLEPTPVKKLLAEQLAVPWPQLSLFLLLPLSIPLAGELTPHVWWVCSPRLLPQPGVTSGSALGDTWALRVWCYTAYPSPPRVCEADISLLFFLSPPFPERRLPSVALPSLDLSRTGATPGTMYIQVTQQQTKKQFNFVCFSQGWGTGVGRVVKCPNTG